MDTLEKQSEMTCYASDTNMELHGTTVVRLNVSELLEDAGNCRQSIHQALDIHPLSEQQKLRVVLDWAHSFLSSRSDIPHEICRYDSLKLADMKQKESEKTPTHKSSSSAKYNIPVFCSAGSNDVLERYELERSKYKNRERNNLISKYKPPSQEDPFTLGINYVAWPENIETEDSKSTELQDPTSKQTPGYDNCRPSGEHIFNHRCHTKISHSSSTQTLTIDDATCLVASSCCSNASGTGAMLLKNNDTDIIFETAQSKRELSGNQKDPRKETQEMKVQKEKKEDGRMEENDRKMHKESFVVCTNDNLNHSDPEKIPEQTAECANPSLAMTIPSNLTVYEQYQLCVDQLHRLKMRQSSESSEKEKETSKETAAPAKAQTQTTPCFEIEKHLNKVQSKRLSVTATTGKKASDTINENQDRTTFKRKTTATEHGEIKEASAAGSAESRSLCQENYVTSTAHLDLHGNRTVKAITATNKVFNTHMETLRTAPADEEESAALTANPDRESHQVDVRGKKKKNGGRAGLSQEEQPHTKKDSTHKHKQRDTHWRTECKTHHCAGIHTQACNFQRHTHFMMTSDQPRPAGVPVCDWLSLPDEVWLSILSLLPRGDLCTVVQVCSRLHTLATDHTLWKCLRLENSTLTEQWLLSVGKRRPRSLCLYSCSSRSVTSCGLEMFFTLCRNTLEEISVTGCIGPGLHGDQMLTLVGQLCDHVTSVDMSWSGATDTGVKALSDGCAGLRLKSIMLNGCHVTDDPLKKLVMRHKQSLCRLEVFGCQFLTSSCLQTVFEMCPGLQHLNIGQVPKVNTLCLTVMTSHIKGLISLNLTGLKAVTDATLKTLLQRCVELRSLTLSSCPGVTDLTLHNISKYTPCIRSLDVSGCKAITDLGVQALTLGCKRLQQLDLSSTGIGNKGVTLLANYCSRHLHTVKLSFCHITLENILELCRCCKRLNVLHVYGCARLPTEREIREVNTTVKVYPLP